MKFWKDMEIAEELPNPYFVLKDKAENIRSGHLNLARGFTKNLGFSEGRKRMEIQHRSLASGDNTSMIEHLAFADQVDLPLKDVFLLAELIQ